MVGVCRPQARLMKGCQFGRRVQDLYVSNPDAIGFLELEPILKRPLLPLGF